MTKSSTPFTCLWLLLAWTYLSSCANYNLYTPRYDQRLGEKIKREIENAPQTYPILSETDHQKIYSYVKSIIDTLLDTRLLNYRNEFAWEVKLIDDSEVLNAFVTPGGYIYVYTGLIKYLESEDQLAGVLAHEIAHADLRHASRQLSQKNSLSTALLIASRGRGDLLTNLGASLVSLKFSRSFEKEADRMAIKLLCATDYRADGLADFFEKLEASGNKRLPAFLSTHPNPGKRVDKIKKNVADLACQGRHTHRRTYQRMKRWLL